MLVYGCGLVADVELCSDGDVKFLLVCLCDGFDEVIGVDVPSIEH